MDNSFEYRFRAVTINLLRIITGLLFMQHGAQKLFGWLDGNSVEIASQIGVAGVLEFFGGLLIVLGLFTRPVAFILFLEMVAAYFLAHMPQGFWPVQNGGELALLYAFVFLYLSAHGGGNFSLDGVLRRGEPDEGAHRVAPSTREPAVS